LKKCKKLKKIKIGDKMDRATTNKPTTGSTQNPYNGRRGTSQDSVLTRGLFACLPKPAQEGLRSKWNTNGVGSAPPNEQQKYRDTEQAYNNAQADFHDQYGTDFPAPSSSNGHSPNWNAKQTGQEPEGKAVVVNDMCFKTILQHPQIPLPVRADNLNEGFPSGAQASAPKGPSGQAAHPFPPFKGLVEGPVKSEPLPAQNPHAAAALNFGFPSLPQTELWHAST